MDISAALTADLAALTHALDSDIDLESQLHTLVGDVKAAIASYLGMTLTLLTDGHEISFTVHDEGAAELGHRREVTASLRIPLELGPNADRGGYLVLYAATPGAFVDLAADLAYAQTLGAETLTLDGHLSAIDHHGGIIGLAEYSSINQAIGVLIDRGHTPDSAREELDRLAAVGNHAVPVAAEQLLASLPRRPPDGGATAS